MATCPTIVAPTLDGSKRRKMGSEISEVPSIDWSTRVRCAAKEADIARKDYGCELVHRYSFLNDGTYAFDQNGEFGRDDRHYSAAWFTHYRRREQLFRPWYPTLGPITNPWEALRVKSVEVFWRATRTYRISPITIHLAVWMMNKLLHTFGRQVDFQYTREAFAGIVAVAFRTALKFEERPEAMWSIRKIWDVLPHFETWGIDRSEQFLMKIEAEALKMVDDCLDVPLALQFFDKYITVGGWPPGLVKHYTSLGHFLLALSTFSSGEHNLLSHVTPSKLAAATVVLSVKIVNSDSNRSYEYFPERFAAFCQYSLRDLHVAIKGLSQMLRRKPNEAGVLGRIYPEWGEHEWM